MGGVGYRYAPGAPCTPPLSSDQAARLCLRPLISRTCRKLDPLYRPYCSVLYCNVHYTPPSFDCIYLHCTVTVLCMDCRLVCRRCTRDCLEKEDLVRRLEGMRDFIPRAAQQELARVLEGASGVKGSGAGQGPRGIAGDASPGPSGGAPPQRPPPAPWNRAHPEVQGAGGAEGLWSLPRPGFREGP